jgi:osmotically-inducible protein OsmY
VAVQYNTGFAVNGRFTMRTLCLLVISAMLCGCTSMLLGNTTSREAPATTSSGSTMSAADSAISGEIRRKLSADPDLRKYTIGIRTQNGRVTLSGTVRGYELRDRAVSLARDTDGVRTVDNRIVVNTNL